MNGFLDLHRTYGRTNERDLIGPNRSTGDQKWPNFDQIGSIFGQFRTFPVYEVCDFLKEDHENKFHTKILKDL